MVQARRNLGKKEQALQDLLVQVRACTHCVLPCGPRPVVQAHGSARLCIIGQAPGRKVHATSIPWNDASGDRLRQWLGLPPEVFYDPRRIALIPMGFCYPGRGVSGDNPPRPECAPRWHEKLMHHLPEMELTLLVGRYAQAYYLGNRCKPTLTDTVRAWREYLALGYLPLPHPSPRNGGWQKRHPWFERELVPALQELVKSLELQERD